MMDTVIFIVVIYLLDLVYDTEQTWTVICVSGVTCGGKSTITRALHNKYVGSVLVKQDSYYLKDDDPRQVQLPHLNWRNRELMSSIDMERMNKDVSEVISRNNTSSSILFLDGFMLYYDKTITSRCDVKFFFVLGKDTCKTRRKKRNRRVPDIVRYFEEYVWPAHVEYKHTVFREMPDLILVDGSANNVTIIENMSSEIGKAVKLKNR
ncbi:nicotinamide riboside kinase 2-like [Macrosteles quadrilineatus]|uniref:nicotinamide riboside kinase 2-like n=1 Tax=Macrosteles quadrilineatus TaxID=74068 RepID=UPI0023E2C565|nr:nicotinamide riboside kinase 2-like [Macrosteles quadrilineatus]